MTKRRRAAGKRRPPKRGTGPVVPRTPALSPRPPAARSPAARPSAAALPALDVPELVRGASSGFTVLLLGSAAQPLASAASAQLGLLWLSLTAALAFVLAGRRTGRAARPLVQGPFAAVLAFTLTLPLVVVLHGGFEIVQSCTTLAFAVVVGALATRLPRRVPPGRGARPDQVT